MDNVVAGPFAGRVAEETARVGAVPASSSGGAAATNVVAFAGRSVPPQGAEDGAGDWLLAHVIELVRYCERNGLEAEEAALADAVETLIGAERRNARRN